MSRPAHDDVKDALASAVTIAVAPARSARDTISEFLNPNIQRTRFGGYK